MYREVFPMFRLFGQIGVGNTPIPRYIVRQVDISIERRKDFKRHLTIKVDAKIEGDFYAKQAPKKLVY